MPSRTVARPLLSPLRKGSMSTLGSVGTFAKNYVRVVCPCGRPLRAKVELAGSEILCWECKNRVRVPLPRATTMETVVALRGAWERVTSGESLGVIVLAAAILTGLMCVLGAGVPLAMVLLMVIAVGYGELIRRDGLFGPADEERPGASARSPWVQGMAAVFLGLSLCAPYFLTLQGIGGTARISGSGWLFLAACAVLVPLAMLMIFGHDRLGNPGARRALRTAWSHPFATLSAIVVVPLTAVLLEGTLLVLARHFDMLGTLLADLLPQTEALSRVFNITTYSLYAPGVSSEPEVLKIYLHQLGQGYTLLGAIPPSLSLPMSHSATYSSFGQPDTAYYFFRVAATFLSATVMLLSLALQARWLGVIGSLEAVKCVAPVAANPAEPGVVTLVAPASA